MSWESQSPSFYQHRLCVHQESTTPQRWCKDTTRCMLSDSVRALGETLKASRSFTSSWTWKSFYSTAPAPQRADSKVIERFICKRLWCNITPSAHVVSLDFTQSADLMWSLRSRASCGMRGACHLAQQRIRTEWAATRTPFSTEELNEFVTTMGEVDVDGTPFVLFIFQRNLKGRESSVKYEVLHRSSWSRDISIVDRPQQNHSFSTRNASNDLKDCRELAFHSWISGLLILGFQASTWSAENFRLRMQTKSFLVETGVHGTEETMRSSGRVPSLFQRRTTVLSFSSFVEARQWKAVMWEMIQNGTRFGPALKTLFNRATTFSNECSSQQIWNEQLTIHGSFHFEVETRNSSNTRTSNLLGTMFSHSMWDPINQPSHNALGRLHQACRPKHLKESSSGCTSFFIEDGLSGWRKIQGSILESSHLSQELRFSITSFSPWAPAQVPCSTLFWALPTRKHCRRQLSCFWML